MIRLWSTLLLLVALSTVALAQEMNKEQWQAEMNSLTQQVNELKARVTSGTGEVEGMQAQSTKLTADLQKCMDELYALVGSNAAEADAYRQQVTDAENDANDLLRLSDAELLARSGEVDALDLRVKKLWENKLSLIPEFWDRLTALNEKVASLKNTIAGSGKVYTVGTWSRNRDCLWNISKKRDIYNNAWLWPKIWQGNRDQIRDPDLISPGQKLKIPPKGDLSSEEKSAANSYYRKRSAR
jgi:nucleoid-associated protein YgaU